MKKLRQHGFGTIAVLLVLAASALIAAIGWLVLTRFSDTPAPATEAARTTKAYTDSSKLYSVEYPIAWSYAESPDCCEGPAKDYTKISRSVRIMPAAVKDEAKGLSLQADRTETLPAEIRKNWQANGHTPEIQKSGQNNIEYVKTVFDGDAEKYTDHAYLITRDGASVFATFRESYQHLTFNTSWDNSAYMPQFEAVINSVQFAQ